MRWRLLLAYVATGAVVALAWRGDWWAVAGAAPVILLPAVVWVRGEMAAARAALRDMPAVGKHRQDGAGHRRNVRLVSTEHVCSQDEAATCGYPVSDNLPD